MGVYVNEYRDAFAPPDYAELFPTPPTVGVLGEVEIELARQDEKWGEQNHPDVGPPATMAYHFARLETEYWKKKNDHRVAKGTLAWDGILLEEVYEALAESDPAKLRAELIQVAAVAVQWVAAIDRRGSASVAA